MYIGLPRSKTPLGVSLSGIPLIYELIGNIGILTIIVMKPKDLMVNLISAKHKCGSGPDPHPVRDAQMMDERNHQDDSGKGFVSPKRHGCTRTPEV